jgi:hypothetical protein
MIAFGKFQAILTTQIQVGFPTDVAPGFRSGMELFEVQPLTDDPASTFANTFFNFFWVGASWRYNFNAAIRVDGNRHRATSGIPQAVLKFMLRITDVSPHDH